MKISNNTLILLAVVLGIGGYRYWQDTQRKKKAIPKEFELSNGIWKIVSELNKASEDTSQIISSLEKSLQIATNDANKIQELYLQNQEATLQEWDKILRENQVID